jgi:hypothetical protein
MTSRSLSYCIGVRYRVARPLGQGGMAQVFQCWDVQLHRWCAVKLMSEGLTARPTLRRRFASEARTLAQLAHRHVVQIFDLVDDVPSPYLVTEYLEGGSAEQLPHPLHPHHAAIVCAQVARALEAAHHAGVVHRDVKPANILLERSGVAKLGDFGIAMLLGERKQGVAGTLGFMAPEQAEGQASPLSDVFSLGATLFTLQSAEPPEVLLSPRREEALDGVPAQLRTIIRRATQPHPPDRISPAEMASALESAAQSLRGRDLGPLPVTLRPPIDPPPDRPCPAEFLGLLSGTRAETGEATAIHESTAEPILTTEALGRAVLQVEVTRGQSELLLAAARTLDRARGPAVPDVLSSGPASGGGRWVALRHEPEGEPLETFAARLPPARRAAWLLPLARQVGELVANAHARKVAHGALEGELARKWIWVHQGQVTLIAGWGGRRLMGLAEQDPEVFRDDVRGVVNLYAWCAGGALPARLERVLRRGRQGEFADLVAFEKARQAAERRGELTARVRAVLGAAGLLLGAALVAGVIVLASASVQRQPIVVPVPVLHGAPAEPGLQEHFDALRRAGAMRVSVEEGDCPEPLLQDWQALDEASAQDLLEDARYGVVQLGWSPVDKIPTPSRAVLVTENWVLLYETKIHGPSAGYTPLGAVREPTLLAASSDWAAVAHGDGGVSVSSLEGSWWTELPAGRPIECLDVRGDHLSVGRGGERELWELRPGVKDTRQRASRELPQRGALRGPPLDLDLSWALEGSTLLRTAGGREAPVATDVIAFLPYERDVIMVNSEHVLSFWTEAQGQTVRLPLPSPLLTARLQQTPARLTLYLLDRELVIEGCALQVANGSASCMGMLAPREP